MTHEEILYLIICIILSCVSFIGGWFAAKYYSLKGRLASDSGLCGDDGNRITEATERIEDSERRAEDLIGATQSIADIIKRYEDSVTENKDMEQDSAYVDTDLDD